MDYLPVFLNIRERYCLVVGGGEVALRKANLLDRAGGRLLVVAPDVGQALTDLVADNGGEIRRRGFAEQDLEDAALVIAATDDETLNERVSQLAGQCGLPVNVVDRPALCSFIVPAVIDRSPVVVAISTGGSSPVLTRRLKEQLEISLPGAYGRLATLLGDFRERVKQRIGDFGRRTRFWERLLQGPLSEMVFSGREDEARAFMEHELEHADAMDVSGEVYLVGAGPGDPDLLTLKALRLMHAADVVLYDRLVSDEILRKVRPDAEKFHVGKRRSEHAVAQEQINEMLVRLAREGKKVLRLKGGDPFIFGRGGEEIEQLAEARIPFQVVPGITAASGCASYAGIPLTHRDHSQSVRFVTGHRKDDRIDLDWPLLAKTDQTLVIYMGLLGLEHICQQLIAHGMDPETPVALIQQGTTRHQKVLIGSVSSMPDIVRRNDVQAPTIVIVGQVVRLHRRLAWFASDEQAAAGP